MSTPATANFAERSCNGKESNWTQTITGKGQFVILLFHGPPESWFDKMWRTGEIGIMQ